MMIILVIGFVLVAFWLWNLCHYDFEDSGCIPSKDECNSCPFPCDKRKN